MIISLSKIELPKHVREVETPKNNLPFWKQIIPMKGDQLPELIRKIVFLVSFAVLIGCGIYFLNSLLFTIKDDQLHKSILEMRDEGLLNPSTSQPVTTLPEEVIDPNKPKEILPEYTALYEKNNDLAGWIQIPVIGSETGEMLIDYPVMQCDNNDYYLKNNFYNEKSKSGEIFADYHEKITADQSPENIILYGHNLYTGTHFTLLTRYATESIDFYKEHYLVNFNTLYEKRQYKIFAGMLINTLEKDGELFPYHKTYNFSSEDKFIDYISQILDRTYFFTDVDFEYGDEIITLSTCWKYPDENARFVIFARRVRDGESLEVNFEKAHKSSNPKFWTQYYEIYGGSWWGRTWKEEDYIKRIDQ